jgi:diguanylate cyclase (GGDEF)-like protein/putative nucleotidyltransferase with HDIG domain
MSVKARLYISFIAVAGFCVLVKDLAAWESKDPSLYLWYLALAVIASQSKISLPSISGTISVFFVFILFGIVDFSLSETLFLGCLATLVQSIWQAPGRPKLASVLFNVGNMALAVAAAYWAYHSPYLRGEHVETALLLAGATVVFFAMNTFPIAAVMALAEHRSLLRIWRDSYFWSFPYYLFGAAVAGAVDFVTRYVGWQTGLLVVPIVYLGYRSYALYLGRIAVEKKHAEEMAALHLRTIEALAMAIEAKDHITHDHLRRVQVYAVEVGKELGLSADELEALRAGALLHDIGKLAVPEHIISKPGRLTREEFDKMKIHPIVGEEILQRVSFPYPVTPIVRSHHEKWNGGGYPDGLKGDEIPIGARILAAVDALDALASDRQYRRALPIEEAMRKVAVESGISYDPKVIEILQRRCHELEQIAQNQGEKARLSTDVKIERGPEPADGFDTSKQSPVAAPSEKPSDFLVSIAAARQEVQSLFELAQDLGNSLSLTETLSLVAMRLKRLIPYDSLAIYVPEGRVLRAEYVTGENSRLFSSMRIPWGQGLSGWVAENRKPIVNGDPAVEPGYPEDEPKFTVCRAALSVPLIGVNGLVSVVTLYHSERDIFTKDHLRILMAIAPKVALAVENALKYQQAESSAATDYMTGLPNARSLFLHLDGELSRCRRSNSPLVVLVGDMNGFKQVNDRFGHLEGNRLLRAVALKLKESCREYDYVARMGGDEFVLVLPGLTVEQAQAKMLRLSAITREAGKETCGVDTISLSIGHAAYPDDGTDAEQLLSEADQRMYAVKQLEKAKIVEPRGYDFDHLPAH